MVDIKRHCRNAILVLCLAMAICEIKGEFNAEADLMETKGVSDDGSDSSQKIFNVLDFGTKADGVKDHARAFVNAFQAACHWKGNARMLVPEGTYYIGPVSFEGPCRSTSPLVFEVMGTIKAHQDISLYKCKEWVNFENLNGLIVTGNGSFDGQGQAVWKNNNCNFDPECVRLSSNLMFQQVKNVVIRGISSVNSKGFHVFITNSDNIRLYDLNIVAPADSPNTDGIHISKSSEVKVYRTVINTGDDCVSMIQGCTNITIKRVVCGAGHGFSIGSLGKYKKERDVRRIMVKNCTLSNTDNGLRIKTWGGSPPSQASGIIFQDIIMKNVRNPIIIDQNYGPATNKPSRVKIKNVKYINVRGTTSSNVAVNLVCSPKAPCQNLQLSDINLKYIGNLHKKSSSLSSACVNANVKYIGVQRPAPCN